MKLLTCLLVFFSISAQPSMYPLVTSITTRILSSTQAIYDGTVGLIDIGPAGDVLVPEGWIMGLAHRHDAFPGGSDTVRMLSTSSSCSQEGGSVSTRAGETFSDAALRAYRMWGRTSFSMHHVGEGNGGECVGYVVAPQLYVPWSSAIHPVGPHPIL